SMGRARAITRAAVCKSNLHQLSLALRQYTVVYRHSIFPYNLAHDYFWPSILEPYYGDTGGVQVCPDAPVDYENQWGYDPWYAAPGITVPFSGWGTVNVAWGRPPTMGSFIGGHDGSYAWNAWMHGGTADTRYFRRLNNVRRGSSTPLWTDGMWVDTWFQNDSNGTVTPPPPHLRGSNALPSRMAGRVCLDRHRRAVSAVFVDGSARRVPLEDLWKLSWNTRSTPMDPPGPLPNE
ncbi:MAG: hypothetical protein OER86_13825, partial [Phycisphaerae bacterium]|nr:hypothetical protein [Phycisphaerae bacterium]